MPDPKKEIEPVVCPNCGNDLKKDDKGNLSCSECGYEQKAG